MTHISGRFLRVFKHSYIHRLQLGFTKVFISTMLLIYLTTLNIVHIHSSGVVYLKCCFYCEANKSDFFLFENMLDIRETCIHPFLEHWMYFSYVNLITQHKFTFPHEKSHLIFSFKGTLTINFRGIGEITYSTHEFRVMDTQADFCREIYVK